VNSLISVLRTNCCRGQTALKKYTRVTKKTGKSKQSKSYFDDKSPTYFPPKLFEFRKQPTSTQSWKPKYIIREMKKTENSLLYADTYKQVKDDNKL